jgi:hypothetical protein
MIPLVDMRLMLVLARRLFEVDRSSLSERGHSVFKFGQVNLNSLMSKVDLLSVLLREHELDLLVVGETWLIPEVKSSFVMIDGYDVVRGDTDTGVRNHEA